MGVSGRVVDLTPDVAVRLAAALGTALKKGAQVVASREALPACRMIAWAMITGLISTGVDVADLRVLPSPVNRHVLKLHGYDAGIHVTTSASDPELVRIQFHEPPGIQLTPACRKRSRSTSRVTSCGESVRTRSARSRTRRASARRTQDLLTTVDADAIRRRNFRIVVDYGFSAASYVLPLVLGPLGVEAVTAHQFATDVEQAVLDLRESLDQAKRLVAAWAPTSASFSTALPSGCT